MRLKLEDAPPPHKLFFNKSRYQCPYTRWRTGDDIRNMAPIFLFCRNAIMPATHAGLIEYEKTTKVTAQASNNLYTKPIGREEPVWI